MDQREGTPKAEGQVQGCPLYELMWAWEAGGRGGWRGRSGICGEFLSRLRLFFSRTQLPRLSAHPLQLWLRAGSLPRSWVSSALSPFVMADLITTPVILLGCFALFLSLLVSEANLHCHK